MKILSTRLFDKTIKKLHANTKLDLDAAVRELLKDPSIGDLKKGDLSGVRVYKFRMVNQLTLLAYEYDEKRQAILLFALGSHENFYRGLKN